MRPLDLLLDRGDGAIELVLDLLRRFGAGDWAAAARRVADPVLIFGVEVPRAKLATNTDASLSGRADRLEELPRDAMDAALLAELIAVPLAPEDRVFFITTRVGEDPVSYGLVVNRELRAIFDPRVFQAWALA